MVFARSLRFFTLATFVAGLLTITISPSAQAGCGCTKPAPTPAAVRPNVTYGGQPVTLFHSSLVNGRPYTIRFTAMNGTTVSIVGTAVNRRDLADAVYKNQLTVNVPTSLPLGPVGITVTQSGQTAPFLSIPDTSFTLAPMPVAVPSQPGKYSYQSFKAAVGRDGTVYFSLDLTGMTMPRTIRAQAKGYALRFSKDNAIFYNTQGFLMQLVGAPIPGLATLTPGSGSDSDILQYQRHEFATFFMQHGERSSHSTDPQDSSWHTDGTRHVDHDRLILAIAGAKVNNITPAAGSTPPFTLELNSYTFFQYGLVGTDAISVTEGAQTMSTPRGGDGDIFTNGVATVGTNAQIFGDVTAITLNVDSSAQIFGQRLTPTQAAQYLPVAIPTGLTNLGSLTLSGGMQQTLNPGSYQVSQLVLNSGSQLFINNASGPVTIYVTGPVIITGGQVIPAEENPEKFAIYVASTSPVQFSVGGQFFGVVYAPQSSVSLLNNAQFFGSFVGKNLTVRAGAQAFYNTALRGE